MNLLDHSAYHSTTIFSYVYSAAKLAKIIHILTICCHKYLKGSAYSLLASKLGHEKKLYLLFGVS